MTDPASSLLPAVMHPMLPRPFRVSRARRELRGTHTLELVSVDDGGAFPFAAGQFNMLYAFGKGEVPISISGDPDSSETLVHTTRAVGAVTRALCAAKPGAVIGVRGPFGSSWPVDEAAGRDVVLVAGGIGLAPLRPALYQILARREEFGRVSLLYGARSPGEMLFRRQLESWRGRFDLEVEVTVDADGPGWRGQVGVVTTLIGRAEFDPLDSLAMVCGPEVMMRFTLRELEAHGLGLDSIYLSMERNMKCAIGFCGHCQFGPTFVCKDGPVFRADRINPLLETREV